MKIQKIIFLSLASFIFITQGSLASSTYFPIQPGKMGPIAQDGTLRSQQYPFTCQTEPVGLGPAIDQDCNAAMQVSYYYKPRGQSTLLPLPRNINGEYYYPNDVDTFASNYLPDFISPGGKYIVRVEQGVINRFIYMIAILEDIVAHKTPELSGYKNKALYYFDGGSGLGHTQASNSAIDFINDPSRLIKDIDVLGLGYAVLYSTGTATSTHYNLKLGLKTAQMVKQQFISEFKEPDFTLGIGGSGGAIQQLIYSEQDPSLLNGLILLFTAFPDMLTQTNYASDCPLLENYFDNLAYDAPTSWKTRGIIEGLNTSAQMPLSKQALTNVNPKLQTLISDGHGSDTCINGWGRVAHSLINPFSEENGHSQSSLWDNENDQVQFGSYPVDEHGLAYNTLDNEGVQYGLQALKLNKIDKERFFDVNAKIGGWKKESEFVAEANYPMSGHHGEYDGWSSQNATASTIPPEALNHMVATRKSASTAAIDAAVKNHLIFTGNVNLPILEIRINHDDVGDIHNAFESFVIRSRLQKFNRANQHVLWFVQNKKFIADTTQDNYWADIAKMGEYIKLTQDESGGLQKAMIFPYFNPTSWPIMLMERWVRKIKEYPTASIVENKPLFFHDGCYLPTKRISPYFDDSAWVGMLDPTAKWKGFCAQNTIIYPTPRVVAGENIASEQLKCPLIPIEEFIKKNGYGTIKMTAADITHLKMIFPTGVCWYG